MTKCLQLVSFGEVTPPQIVCYLALRYSKGNEALGAIPSGPPQSRARGPVSPRLRLLAADVMLWARADRDSLRAGVERARETMLQHAFRQPLTLHTEALHSGFRIRCSVVTR